MFLVVRSLSGVDRLHHRSEKGEVVVVCGPSGSGKSTLIKTVNGLEPIQQGDIPVNGTQVNDKKTNLRSCAKVGMVFQHFELFPHLSIIDNLTLAQVSAQARQDRLAREGPEAGARRPLRPCQQVPVSVRRPAAARRHRPRAVHGSYRHAVR